MVDSPDSRLPQTHAGGLNRDRRVGEECWQHCQLGIDRSWRASDPRRVAHRGRWQVLRGVAARPPRVSTSYARPPRCSGPAGDTPSVPPLRQQLWALRAGLDRRASQPSMTTQKVRRRAIAAAGADWRQRSPRGSAPTVDTGWPAQVRCSAPGGAVSVGETGCRRKGPPGLMGVYHHDPRGGEPRASEHVTAAAARHHAM